MRVGSALLLLSLALSGCIQAPGATTPPAPSAAGGLLVAVPSTISGLDLLGNLELGGANDMGFLGDLAVVATHGQGTYFVDVRDPATPTILSNVSCNGKDADVRRIGARVIATISWQGDDGCPDSAPKGGIRLVDVTDARVPRVLAQVPLVYGSHTHTPYGDTGLVYNSAYNLAGDPTKSPMDHHRAEILDIRDPDNPRVAGEFVFPPTSSSIGCHDILAEPALDRAICGGISETMIWDTTDPMAPKIVATILNPKISIHHSAATTRNGTLLAIGDEYAGVLAPACHPAGQTPTGAIWFYDLTTPTAPREMGYVAPQSGEPGTVCTAHNFNWIDDDHLVAGFYAGGTLLIDASDPSSPTVLQQVRNAPTSSWASYYYRGAVFSGDGSRGLDVYRLV